MIMSPNAINIDYFTLYHITIPSFSCYSPHSVAILIPILLSPVPIPLTPHSYSPNASFLFSFLFSYPSHSYSLIPSFLFSHPLISILLQLAIEPDNSHVFLSCGEDSNVLQIDLREDNSERNKLVTF